MLLVVCLFLSMEDVSVVLDYWVVFLLVKVIVKDVLVKLGQYVVKGDVLLMLSLEIDLMVYVMEVMCIVLDDWGVQQCNGGFLVWCLIMEDMMVVVCVDQVNVWDKFYCWVEVVGQVVDLQVKLDQVIVFDQLFMVIFIGDIIVVVCFKDDDVKQLYVG